MTPAAGDAFGAGGTEPWAAALRDGSGRLVLVPEGGAAEQPLDLDRWTADADRVDRRLLVGLPAPLIDIGCGPGRMVRAAAEAGMEAWGLDAERAAVDRCRAAGLPAIHGDLFDRLPREGDWGSVLLLDGNVGIGGDVTALLARCRTLLRPGGVLVAEAHPDRARDSAAVYRVRDAEGRTSAPFRWSQAGVPAVVAAAHGFRVDGVRRMRGRSFVRLIAC